MFHNTDPYLNASGWTSVPEKYGISRIRIRFPNNSAYSYTTDTLRYARDTLKKIVGQNVFFFEIKSRNSCVGLIFSNHVPLWIKFFYD